MSTEFMFYCRLNRHMEVEGLFVSVGVGFRMSLYKEYITHCFFVAESPVHHRRA